MSDASTFALLTAFAAGVVSFLSPCVLPLVPGYVSYVAGDALIHGAPGRRGARRLATFGRSLAFVAGFSTVFIALGAGASVLGEFLLRYKNEAGVVGGIVVLAFGLFTTGLIRIPWLQRDLRVHATIVGSRPLGAYLIGLSFAFGWTPCIGPVLGAILTVTAVAATASTGVVLLSAYSLGLGIPFLITAASTGALIGRLTRARRTGRWLQFGAGIGMIAAGIAMMTGLLSRVSYWLLETFPAFSTLG